MWHLKTTTLPVVIVTLGIISKSYMCIRFLIALKYGNCKILYSWILLTSCIDFSPCNDYNYIFFSLIEWHLVYLHLLIQKKCCLMKSLVDIWEQLLLSKAKAKHNNKIPVKE